MEKLNISPDKLMESLMEESPDTFQPNYIFSDTEKSAPIEKITVSKSGRIDTYLQGIKYPYSGYPYRPMIKSACIIKRITRLFITSFPMHNKMNIIKLFIIRNNIRNLIPNLIVLFSFVIGSRRLQERYYSPAVREIYRVFNIVIDREKGQEMKDRWTRIRDVVCLIIQFNPAYRYRLRDFLSEINLKKIKLAKRDLFYAKQSDDYRYGETKK